MNNWFKRNWLFLVIILLVVGLFVAYFSINKIDILYLISHPSPQFISTSIITLIVAVLLIVIYLGFKRK